ncbi:MULTISPECIES: hypothetical protein [unclassified Streptomyces]|uniref:hypothetical protein n=1 Tax=unclassified Streptomyces TaxID=2593676 RepID=UPI0022531E0A|nr:MULTISPECIES: hypothetical protein [unclassified Streptomyces]MCX5328556.1 hypothetical protein [Streptomyces sp. NBC_00140]MCX5357963.1 hypothetical protein [Streptomyces sp. NBC_00124]
MRLTVIGTGYVGAVHAACMPEIVHEVLSFDVDGERVAALAAGRPPRYESGLSRMFQRAVTTGRLRFTTSPTEVARFADTHLVCVVTPQRPGSGAADLRHVEGVMDALAPGLSRAGHNGARWSASPPCRSARRTGLPPSYARPVRRRRRLEPEFLREGCAIQDTLRPERIVAGAAARGLRAPPGRPAGLATVVRNPAMVDARNTLDAQAWHSAGRRVCSPGRPRLG